MNQNQIRETTPIQLKLVTVLCSALTLGTSWLCWQFWDMDRTWSVTLDKRLEPFVSEKMFRAEVESLRRESRIQFDALRDSLSDLKQSVNARAQSDK